MRLRARRSRMDCMPALAGGKPANRRTRRAVTPRNSGGRALRRACPYIHAFPPVRPRYLRARCRYIPRRHCMLPTVSRHRIAMRSEAARGDREGAMISRLRRRVRRIIKLIYVAVEAGAASCYIRREFAGGSRGAAQAGVCGRGFPAQRVVQACSGRSR